MTTRALTSDAKTHGILTLTCAGLLNGDDSAAFAEPNRAATMSVQVTGTFGDGGVQLKGRKHCIRNTTRRGRHRRFSFTIAFEAIFTGVRHNPDTRRNQSKSPLCKAPPSPNGRGFFFAPIGPRSNCRSRASSGSMMSRVARSDSPEPFRPKLCFLLHERRRGPSKHPSKPPAASQVGGVVSRSPGRCERQNSGDRSRRQVQGLRRFGERPDRGQAQLSHQRTTRRAY